VIVLDQSIVVIFEFGGAAVNPGAAVRARPKIHSRECWVWGMENEASDHPEREIVPRLFRRGGGMSSTAVRTQSTGLPPLTVGVYGITVVCGLLDAASFLGLGLIFVETMTGNILLLAFSLGVRGTFGRFATDFPGGTVLPYLAALGAFALGAVAGGRLVRAKEPGRRAGFAIEASMIGLAVLVVAATHPGADNVARYPVIAVLACAMGLQNALMRRWGIPDLATNLMTLTFTGLHADSTLAGGDNPRALRRSVSIVIFTVGATVGAFMTRYGILWPLLTAFTVFVLALPILLQPRDEAVEGR
jgi:uncharacterized membrane protein YoaK (UPF0700 family)